MSSRKFLNFTFIGLFVLSFSCRTAEAPQQPEATAPPVQEQPQPDTVYQPQPDVRSYSEYRGSRTKLHDLIHTRLDVRFDWENQHLLGTARLELAPHFYPQSELVLDAKGFDLHEVQLLKGNQRTPLQYTYDEEQITIQLDREYARGENYFVEIEYTAKPNERTAGGSAAITSDKGLYFINPVGAEPDKPRQIWTQGETEASSVWFPTIDAPNQRSTQEMYITVNNRYKTLSNGVLVSSSLQNDSIRTDYWRMEKSHAPYLFMMAIGKFAVVNDEWEGLEVDYYVEPEFEQYAKAIFGNTPEMMSFFSEMLDYEYPWSKYAQVVVRDYVSGAMENTSASTFMEALQVDDRELLDNNWDYIIAHELFHQWFGDLVTTESWSNLTLNEAFANYSEYLWSEYKYGEDVAGHTLMQEGTSYFNEAEQKQVDLIRFYYDDKEDMFDSHTYAKGGRILHMLRNYVGDEAFFASLSHYLKQHEYKPVEVHDLRLAFEEVTGEDLNWFFNQWFLASGHPVLEVEDRYENGTLTISVRQQQNLMTTPLYRIPLYVDVYQGEDKLRFAMDITEQYQEIELEVPQQPELVIFDAEEQLLAELSHEKTVEELRYQFNNADHYISRYKALAQLLEEGAADAANKEVFLNALEDESYFIRRLALGAFEDYQGEDRAEIAARIARMTEDEKSLVRADAINILASLDPGTYQEQFRKGLEDESYSVIAASIYGYSQTEAADKAERFREFEELNKGDISLALADYYITNSIEDRYEWFAEQLRKKQGGDLYYFINYFAQYISTQPVENMQEGAEMLENYAKEHSTYYVRYAAFNALAMLEGLPNQEDILREIVEQEEDPRLQQAYQRFF